jgi:hypothetical protein
MTGYTVSTINNRKQTTIRQLGTVQQARHYFHIFIIPVVVPAWWTQKGRACHAGYNSPQHTLVQLTATQPNCCYWAGGAVEQITQPNYHHCFILLFLLGSQARPLDRYYQLLRYCPHSCPRHCRPTSFFWILKYFWWTFLKEASKVS